MKNTIIRSGWLFLLLVMSFSSVLAQEGDAAEAAADSSSPGLMIGILGFGGIVIVGLAIAMNSQQSAENEDE